MAWIYLVTAALFEIGWPLGFKMAHLSGHRAAWIAFSVAAMALSGAFLYLAQKHIPTFLLGVLFFGDNSSFYGWLGVIFIISGVILLKISHLGA